MKNFDFAIVTPSYAPDFERCRLLSWSIQQFVSPTVTHHIIVERRDLELFRQLESPYTKIHIVQSLLPWWIQRISGFKNGWFSFKSLPLRNWIVQQIVKISSAQCVEEDVLVFVDSDVTFIRPFNLETSFIRSGLVRLFREHSYDAPAHVKGHQAANKLLGIPNNVYPDPGYI
ncbi:DUF6492 family protein, partial [Aetokthonos hydrillicola]